MTITVSERNLAFHVIRAAAADDDAVAGVGAPERARAIQHGFGQTVPPIMAKLATRLGVLATLLEGTPADLSASA